jgi:uncharacterized membrane protein YgcG
MLADRLYVAVRPRGILECLDLAVMFFGRRPLAMTLATAAGALPCILLNRLLVSGRPGDASLVILGYFLLAFETAWASIPLTLYLGQAVFAERFSWRAAFHGFLATLPAMLLIQGLLRAFFLVLVVLAPVVFIGMYYVNQVILLERTPLSRVWSRRAAIQKKNELHIFTLVMLDGGLLLVGVPLVTNVLGAITAVWNGRPVVWMPAFASDAGPLAAVFSWHGQIAFWSVCSLLTTLRFFTYLDARIRKEGWDIELKLRSEETYVGLESSARDGRQQSVRRRVAAHACWVGVTLVAVAAGASGAEPGVSPAAGEAARRAVARQSFPWYDAPLDRYRQLIQPHDSEATAAESEQAASRDRQSSGGSGQRGQSAGSGRGSTVGGGTGSPPQQRPSLSLPLLETGNLGVMLVIGLFAAAACIIIYVLVRNGLGSRDSPDGDTSEPQLETVVEEGPSDMLPHGVRRTDGDLLERAATHAQRGEFEQAMLFFHAWQLVELDRRGGLSLAREKTNRQYVAEVAAADPSIVGLFRRSSRLFEDAYFGGLPVPQADFLEVWEARGRILSSEHTVRG